eukprot:6183071-Pleurochrysis_carterae.AAC.1
MIRISKYRAIEGGDSTASGSTARVTVSQYVVETEDGEIPLCGCWRQFQETTASRDKPSRDRQVHPRREEGALAAAAAAVLATAGRPQLRRRPRKAARHEQ